MNAVVLAFGRWRRVRSQFHLREGGQVLELTVEVPDHDELLPVPCKILDLVSWRSLRLFGCLLGGVVEITAERRALTDED